MNGLFREEKAEEPEQPKYRDRAKERREDQNPDYEELAFHKVAPPGTVDIGCDSKTSLFSRLVYSHLRKFIHRS